MEKILILLEFTKYIYNKKIIYPTNDECQSNGQTESLQHKHQLETEQGKSHQHIMGNKDMGKMKINN